MTISVALWLEAGRIVQNQTINTLVFVLVYNLCFF